MYFCSRCPTPLVGQSRQRCPAQAAAPSGTGREPLPQARMQKCGQIQKAIKPRNTWACRIKHIWLLSTGFGLWWWRSSRTNTPKTSCEDGAMKHNVLSKRLWPKGDEAAGICQNPTEPCTRSFGTGCGMTQGPAPAWGWPGDQWDQHCDRHPQLGEEHAVDDATPIGAKQVNIHCKGDERREY